ncbi:MAG: hypothetical protein AAF798_11975 [Bacteroidota bacterium]
MKINNYLTWLALLAMAACNIKTQKLNTAAKTIHLLEGEDTLSVGYPGHTLLTHFNGQVLLQEDLNQDSLQDIAFLAMVGEELEEKADTAAIKLFIFTQQPDGSYSLAASSGKLGSAKTMRTGYDVLFFEGDLIRYMHMTMRSEVELSFEYFFDTNNWMLLEKEALFFGNPTPPKQIIMRYREGKRILHATKWGEPNEEPIALPQKVSAIDNVLMPLESINEETIYSDLYE